MDRLRVIYLAGMTRSGTTVLDRILGTLDGVTSFCEIKLLWSTGFEKNEICSCGSRFDACDFWVPVARDLADLDFKRIQELQQSVDRTRHFFKMLWGPRSAQFKAQLAEYKEALRRLYFKLAEQSGTNIIIDSSKTSTSALILGEIEGIDVWVVHMVRDARAVVHSWQKQKFSPQWNSNMPNLSPFQATCAWAHNNLTCSLLSLKLPYQRLGYEAFAANPREVLAATLAKIPPVADKTLPFENANTIGLPELHSMSGNPDRFNHGSTTIRVDDKWRTNLAPGSRRVATLVGYPLLAWYGYI